MDTTGNSQTRAKNKYAKKAYDDIRVQVKKGGRAIIRAYTTEQGKTINGFVNELLEEKIPELKKLKEQSGTNEQPTTE